MCDDKGVLLAFLPPYSSDFNPIEESFGPLKAWMRTNRSLAVEYGTDFGAFPEVAVQQVGRQLDGSAHFRPRQYGLNEAAGCYQQQQEALGRDGGRGRDRGSTQCILL